MLRYRRYRAFLAFVAFTLFGVYYILAGESEWQPASLAQQRFGLNIKDGASATDGSAGLPDLGGERSGEKIETTQLGKPKATTEIQEEEEVEELPRKYDQDKPSTRPKKPAAKPKVPLSDEEDEEQTAAKVKRPNDKVKGATTDGAAKERPVKDASFSSGAAAAAGDSPRGGSAVKQAAGAVAPVAAAASSAPTKVQEIVMAPSQTSQPTSSTSFGPPKPRDNVRWSKQPEHFPVSSTMALPSGPAKAIPTVQAQFPKEDSASKQERLQKLGEIKRVALRNWKNYRELAWMHDELKPTTGSFKDPFGGWAATLVDALDTLWIMGARAEFEDALTGVEQIDFTWCLRDDIPLFETVIRYLGGLLGAYDVSGAKYSILLTKAVELAEILMGAFDTPNRMPITMYHWKPAFASQPHRAGSQVVMAELGTLSLEFTRLAQLTGEPKYYDAVARITDALEEWQTRTNDPTKLPGLFPLQVDASGCMKADLFSHAEPSWAQEIMAQVEKLDRPPLVGGAIQAGAKLPDRGAPQPVAPPKPSGTPGPDAFDHTQHDDLEQDIQKSSAGAGESERTRSGSSAAALPPVPDKDGDSNGESTNRATSKTANARSNAAIDPDDEDPVVPVKQAASHADRPSGSSAFKEKRQLDDSASLAAKGASKEVTGSQKAATALAGKEETTTRKTDTLADSTNEPAAAKSSSLDTSDRPVQGLAKIPQGTSSLSYLSDEIEICAPSNLTSGNRSGRDKFTLGGMADSTYEYFPKEYLLLGGLEDKYREMHERVVAAADEHLLFRPQIPGNHDILISGDYDAWFSLEEEAKGKKVIQGMLMPDTHHLSCFVGGMYALGSRIFDRPQDLATASKLTQGCVYAYSITATGVMPESLSFMPCKDKTNCKWSEEEYGNYMDPDGLARQERYRAALKDYEQKVEAAKSGKLVPAFSAPLEEEVSSPVAKRAVAEEQETEKVQPMKEASASSSTPPASQEPNRRKEGAGSDTTYSVAKDDGSREIIYDKTPSAHDPPVIAEPFEELYKPVPPAKHEDVVRELVQRQGLSGGMTHITHSKYILRPEAIESVWYMYRITGDRHWREVGWNMFTSIDKATAGLYGNTAIADVTGRTVMELDSQESFFLAETLKYFYLLFSEESVISLDEWVLNTEAHPFRRPKAGKRLV